MGTQRQQSDHTADRLLSGIGRGFFRLVVLFFLALSLLCATFWWRSSRTLDVVFHDNSDGRMQIISAIDRLLVIGQSTEVKSKAIPGSWSYGAEPLPDLADGWEPSVWKLIGIEWSNELPDPQMGGNGWWLRMKWSTLTGLFGLPPLLWMIQQRRRARRESLAIAGYCPKCEFPLTACACERS